MKVIKTQIPGVLLLEPQIFDDQRGFFFESYNAERYAAHGISVHFVQDNFSHSKKGVLRGLHYQLEHTQGKLIWVTRGKVFDVAIDIRYGSPTFSRWVGVILDATKSQQLYIPPGFAHGFCTLSDEADFHYKCTDYYHPASEMGVCWNDPDLAITWPILDPILSNKDSFYPCLKDIKPEHLPPYEISGNKL